MEVAQSMDSSGSGKRRKVGSGELSSSPSKSVLMKGCDSEDAISTSEMLSDHSVKKEELNGSNADEISFCSGEIPASCCSSDGSITEKLKCADLEEISGIETTVSGNSDRRESLHQLQVKSNILSPNSMATNFTTPESEFKAESGELESFTTEKTPAQTVPPEKMPTAAELEEFFVAAEKDVHNRFKDKYNYDIANDVPLKGRFEWVQLKAKGMKDGEEDDE